MSLLEVSGSHYKCGKEIGTAFGRQITKAVSEAAKEASWNPALEASKPYWEATESAYPNLLEEIRGVAAGSELPANAVFTYIVEELFVGNTAVPVAKACTDIIFTPPHSEHVLIGHNNDLPHSFRRLMDPVLRTYEDGTQVFTVGPLGYYLSAGANSHGVVLTGNELSPNDNKPGIPRAIVARAILEAKDFDEAVVIATDPRRASSYNNVIAKGNQVVVIEGSGTKYESLFPTDTGSAVHANHYVCGAMRGCQEAGEPGVFESSYGRQSHAERMVTRQLRHGRPVVIEDVQRMLRNHDGKKGYDRNLSVCRHGKYNRTVMAMTVDMGSGEIDLAMGYPCRHSFEKIWQIPS